MIRTVLFDLDGTLLPLDQELFTNVYFRELSAKLLPHGYDAQRLIAGIWKGTEAMIQNDGRMTNEERFWEVFPDYVGAQAREDIAVFAEFYEQEFEKVKTAVGFTEQAGKIIQYVRQKKRSLVLASNPLFPLIAQEKRMRWAGVNVADFSYITSYENSSFCKPNPRYYQEILAKIACRPEECLMIGNDVREDMVAAELGIKVFLLTDSLLNKDQKDISVYPHGNYDDLRNFLAANLE